MNLLKKNGMKVAAAFMVSTLVLVGCSNADTSKKDMKMDKEKSSMEMKKDKNMEKDKMHMEKDKMKKDDMHKDNMKKDDMMDKDKMNETMNKGEKLKDFTLMDVDGNKVKLSDYKGKKVYVKFWASWCSVCLDTLPETDKLAGKENDFEVISIVSPGFGNEKKEEEFKKWYKSLGYKNLKVLMDTNGEAIVKLLNIKGYPSSAYIGTDGVLVKFMPGYQNEEQIKTMMKEVK